MKEMLNEIKKIKFRQFAHFIFCIGLVVDVILPNTNSTGLVLFGVVVILAYLQDVLDLLERNLKLHVQSVQIWREIASGKNKEGK